MKMHKRIVLVLILSIFLAYKLYSAQNNADTELSKSSALEIAEKIPNHTDDDIGIIQKGIRHSDERIVLAYLGCIQRIAYYNSGFQHSINDKRIIAGFSTDNTIDYLISLLGKSNNAKFKAEVARTLVLMAERADIETEVYKLADSYTDYSYKQVIYDFIILDGVSSPSIWQEFLDILTADITEESVNLALSVAYSKTRSDEILPILVDMLEAQNKVLPNRVALGIKQYGNKAFPYKSRIEAVYNTMAPENVPLDLPVKLLERYEMARPILEDTLADLN